MFNAYKKWASNQIGMLNFKNTEVLFLRTFFLYIHNIKIYGFITEYIVDFKTK